MQLFVCIILCCMINHTFFKDTGRNTHTILSTEGDSSPSAPAVSPKPATKPAKPTSLDNPPHIHSTSSAPSTHKAKPSESPRLPTPDYEHKPFTPQPPPAKNKPLPAAPQPSESKRAAPPSQDTKKVAPSPPAKENKKLSPSDSTAQVEDKIDALYKELLPKVSTWICCAYHRLFVRDLIIIWCAVISEHNTVKKMVIQWWKKDI